MRCRCFHHHTFGVIHPHAGRHSALSIVIATTFAWFHRRLAAVQNRIQIIDVGRRNAAIRRDRNLRAGEVNLSLIQLVTPFENVWSWRGWSLQLLKKPLELSKSREVCTPPPLESKQCCGGSGTTYTVTVTAVIDPEPTFSRRFVSTADNEIVSELF